MPMTMAEAVTFLASFQAGDTSQYDYTRLLPSLTEAVNKVATQWKDEMPLTPENTDLLHVYDVSASAFGTIPISALPGSSGDMLAANNLSDLVNKATARSNLFEGAQGNTVFHGTLAWTATPLLSAIQVADGGGIHTDTNDDRILVANATEGLIAVSGTNIRQYIRSGNTGGPFEWAIYANANSTAGGSKVKLFDLLSDGKAAFHGVGYLKAHSCTTAEEAGLGSLTGGEHWFNSTTGKMRFHNGTAIQDLGGTGGGGISSVVDADDWADTGIGANLIPHGNSGGTEFDVRSDFSYDGTAFKFLGYQFVISGGSITAQTSGGSTANVKANNFQPTDGNGLFLGGSHCIQLWSTGGNPNRHKNPEGHELDNVVYLGAPTSAPTVPAGYVSLYFSGSDLVARNSSGQEINLGTFA